MNCSSCGKDFGRFYWLYLRWHKQSGAYRCGRCYFVEGGYAGENEKDAFARINNALPLSLPSNWLVVLICFMFILPVAAGLFIEGKKAEMWSAIEPGSMSNLKEGDFVKVYGNINMTAGWEMSGSEHSSTDKHGHTTYSFSPEFKPFYLQNKTGNRTDNILITQGDSVTIYTSDNTFSTPHGATGWKYVTGDYIWVIGTVNKDSQGNLAISANAVAPYYKALSNDAAWNMLFSYIIAAIALLPFVLVLLVGVFRRISHDKKILAGTIYRPTGDEFSGIGAIRVIENYRRPLYLLLVQVISIIFAGIGVFLLLMYSSPILYRAVIVSVALEMFVIAALMQFVYFYIWQSPTQAGFYDDGVRLRYADDRLSMSLMTLLRWGDIENIRLVRYGKGSHWVIRYRSGYEKNFTNIPSNIRNDVILELERRRAAALPPLPPPPPPPWR